MLALAAAAAGFTNALAGGGTLITFPALMAAGFPPVAANVTSTLALVPGFIGGALAQRRDLVGQGRWLVALLPPAALGGAVGAWLLLRGSARAFEVLIPWLILSATALIAVQEPLRRWLVSRTAPSGSTTPAEAHRPCRACAAIPVALAAVYGGYFGAGLSVIFLAVLGILVADDFRRINAAKQVMSFSANFAAAVYLAFAPAIMWSVVFIMLLGALIGGSLGGRLASRIDAKKLRALVVVLGLIIGLVYLWR
jgi:uncharacterized membrane protein YfcA